ncbi:hypothetical protein [Streptomyces agglomeratus]|uniref:hypothetical protein n=1 Tax=Streptomyces agglomeratus TaxID=285458 RepID=UPI00114CC0BB|nr:hypothetical protein [Streptomyces agglomeratus]
MASADGLERVIAPAHADPQTNPAIVGVCRIGEHEFCDGNQDIKAGGVVAVPLRCACTCHRERRN